MTECSAPRHRKLGSPLGTHQVLTFSAVASCRSISVKQTSAFYSGVQFFLFIKWKTGLRSQVHQSAVSALSFTVLVSVPLRNRNIIARGARRGKPAPGGRAWGHCRQMSSVHAWRQRPRSCGWSATRYCRPSPHSKTCTPGEEGEGQEWGAGSREPTKEGQRLEWTVQPVHRPACGYLPLQGVELRPPWEASS